jgi:DNA-binding LacI/PurR family transcriptional regulator
LAVHLATQAVLQCGYRRPGFVLMNFLASGTNVPLQAQALYEIREITARFGRCPESFIFEPSDDSYSAFRGWLRANRPDVIISSNAQPYHWLTRPMSSRHKPLTIPGDIAFVCLRFVPEAPDLPFTDLRVREQGRQAVDLLH